MGLLQISTDCVTYYYHFVKETDFEYFYVIKIESRISFVIAHRLSTIHDTDKVVVIWDGEIVEQDTHRDFLKKKGFFYHLNLSQFKGKVI